MYFTEDSHAVLSTVYILTRKLDGIVSFHTNAQLANKQLAKKWTIACLHVPYARSDFQPLYFSFVLYYYPYPKQDYACIWVMYILLGMMLRKPGKIHRLYSMMKADSQ